MQSVRDKEPTRSSELPFALAEPPRLFLRPFLPTLIMQKEKRHSFEYRFIGFRQLPILPGRFQTSTFRGLECYLNCPAACIHHWNGPALNTKRKETCFCKSPYLDSGNYLSSRAVSRHVLSGVWNVILTVPQLASITGTARR